MKALEVTSYIAIVLLFFCMVANTDSDYYLFTRVYLLFACCSIGFTLWQKQRTILAILFFTAAITYNPIKTLGFGYTAWQFIDLLTILLFVYYLFEEHLSNIWFSHKHRLVPHLTWKNLFILTGVPLVLLGLVTIYSLSLSRSNYDSIEPSYDYIETPASATNQADSIFNTSPHYAIAENVNLRNSPIPNSTVITTINIGEELYLKTDQTNYEWSHVLFKGQEGWVSSQFIGLKTDLERILTEKIRKNKDDFQNLHNTYLNEQETINLKKSELDDYKRGIGDTEFSVYTQNAELENLVTNLTVKQYSFKQKLLKLVKSTNLLVDKYNSLQGYIVIEKLSTDIRDYRD
jgi:uncharacterized protein YgiM (DUF1202 family)